MAQKMLAYIKEQPAVWTAMVKKRKEGFRALRETFTKRPVKRILIIGSGSSYNAGDMAAEFFTEALGIEAEALAPTRLSALPQLLDPASTLVFAASQTGRSTSTLSAVKTLRQQGFPVVAVTAIEDCPLVRACEWYQPIDCGEETVGPKTKGQTATVLTLYLAGMALCEGWGMLSAKREEELAGALLAAFEAAPENIERCCAFVQKHVGMLAEKPCFTLIADGLGYPMIKEGALKILETLSVSAAAYEFEEYLHGVNHTIQPGVCNLVVPFLPENLERMKRMNDYCLSHGCDNFVVTTAPWEDGEKVLKLKGSGSRYTAPFETLPFFQVVSVYGSEAKDIECDEPRLLDFYQSLDTKAQDEGSTEWKG